MADGDASQRYALSFTSGALLMREALIVAPLYLRERSWGTVRAAIEEDNLLQSRTVASGHRLAREVAERLAVLTVDEIEMLVAATATERGHLLWAAACRRYVFIGEFAEEVVREKFLLLTRSLSYDDFDYFVRGKALWHEELSALRRSTLHKLRSTAFRMLSEAGLLSDEGHLLPAMPSQRVISVLSQRTPSDLRFFPAADAATGSAVR